MPLVALAVADRFLGEPDPAGVDPGSRPGGSGPIPEPSGPDAGPPSTPDDREMFGFDGAYADPDPMVLVVRYGDSGSCPSQAVQHSVVEEPDRIIVDLSRCRAHGAGLHGGLPGRPRPRRVASAARRPRGGRRLAQGAGTGLDRLTALRLSRAGPAAAHERP